MELAQSLREQGLSYEALYEDWPYRTPRDAWEHESHVVNQAMAIKEGALASLLDGEHADDSFSEKMYTLLRNSLSRSCSGPSIGRSKFRPKMPTVYLSDDPR